MPICNLCKKEMTQMHRKDNPYNIMWICESKKCVMFFDSKEIDTWSIVQREYTDFDKAEAKNLHRQGLSYRKISRRLNIPKSTLACWL